MDKILIGYQYSPVDGKYLGEYRFENNLDKEAVHLPPHTTLVKPPVAPIGFYARWDNTVWEVLPDPVEPLCLKFDRLTDEQLGQLEPDFVATLPTVLKSETLEQRYTNARVTHENKCREREQAKQQALAEELDTKQREVRGQHEALRANLAAKGKSV